MEEREARKLLQENSEENAIGTLGAEALPGAAAAGAVPEALVPGGAPDAVERALERLWLVAQAQSFGFSRGQFAAILLQAGETQNWGGAGLDAPGAVKAAFLKSLKVDDLMLARACAKGDERAWEIFLTRYREVLYRAAYALAKDESAGRDLADSLYADLYGMAENGVRRSRLDSFMGRGSLAGWLRAVLAQRYVDGYRRTRREENLDEQEMERLPVASAPEAAPATPEDLRLLGHSVAMVLSAMDAEGRFLLAAYYLDGRALWQIAKLLGVHESTISRRLDRLTGTLRKAVLNELQKAGLSRRAAQEALEVDVRDIELNIRKLLQGAQQSPFEGERVEAGP
jgi:RNA polymerase sigma-70 factor (ECF subfamily)